ncbi:MAG: hypothetical protein LBQ50_03045 [Planctomycetaceae bacterium]|nr:hypothetical protein [Planctomycetaceae bacterium]
MLLQGWQKVAHKGSSYWKIGTNNGDRLLPVLLQLQQPTPLILEEPQSLKESRIENSPLDTPKQEQRKKNNNPQQPSNSKEPKNVR